MKSGFLNIHDMVLVLAFAECLFLATIIRLIPVQRAQARHLLSVFMLLMAGWIIPTLLIWNEELQKLPINSTVFSTVLISVCILLQGPCLYLYLCSLMRPINWRDPHLLIHLLPVVPVLFAIFFYHLDGRSWLPWTQLPVQQRMAVKFCWAVTRCSPLLYLFACITVEYRLRQQHRQVYSSISSVDMKLADLVLFGFFLHWLWNGIGYFIGGYISATANDWMGIADNYLVVLQVNGLFVLGLLNTRELLSHALLDVSTEKTADKSEPPIAEEKIQLIETAIANKVYLENNINLERFAELAGLKARDVSIIVNQHYKLNFFEFINGLRIEEAKRILSSPENDHLNILDVLYQSGFNSQSAFQRFFKRLEGCSPSEFRREAQKKRKTKTLK